MRNAVRTPILITKGWLEGRFIRRARKQFRCECRGRCLGTALGSPALIYTGSLYAEHELSPDKAGGFGMARICLDCAGEEVMALVSQEVEP